MKCWGQGKSGIGSNWIMVRIRVNVKLGLGLYSYGYVLG